MWSLAALCRARGHEGRRCWPRVLRVGQGPSLLPTPTRRGQMPLPVPLPPGPPPETGLLTDPRPVYVVRGQGGEPDCAFSVQEQGLSSERGRAAAPPPPPPAAPRRPGSQRAAPTTRLNYDSSGGGGEADPPPSPAPQ